MIYFILFLGLILRLVSLNQSLWLDEATTALASQMLIPDFFTKFMSADFHPPLYYLVIHYWTLLFGTSEIVLRFPSVIFGVGTIYVVYIIAKDLKFKNALVPALFLATSGLHVYYSQEARMYSMVTFLASYSILLFLRKKWLVFSFVLPLLFLTDYLALIILPVLVIYVLIFERKYLKNILAAVVPLGFTFVLWIPTFFQQLENGFTLKEGASGWWNILGIVTYKNIALIPTKFMIGRISFDNKYLYFALIVSIFIVFIFQILKSRNKLIWLWFLLSLVLGIFLSFFIPTLTYFRYLFILPAFYLLVSETISKRIILLILALNLVSTSLYLFNTKYHREDWRGVAKLIGNERIVFPANSQKEALIYYGKGESIISKGELTNREENIWLSRYVWEIFDSNDSTRKYIENLGYNKTTDANLNGILVFKYARRN